MNTTDLRVIRRLGGPKNSCVSLQECPDVFELSDASFAVIGKDITAEARSKLPPGSGCGDDERIVMVPRAILIAAKRDIPDV